MKESATQRKRGAPLVAPRIPLVKRLVRRDQVLVRKNRREPSRLFLIVHHHDGNHTQRLFAGMADGHFALQVLQEAVREMIQSTLAPGVLPVPRAAVGTDEFHLVLLRIAVQGRPPGAANTNRLRILPVHGSQPPRSTSSMDKMHNTITQVQFSVTPSI